MSELLRHGDPVVRRVPQLARFRARCAALTEQDLTMPQVLHRWTVEHFRDFWGEFLRWADLAWEGSAETVCAGDDVETARFFPDVRLNYAENLLRPLLDVDDNAVALTAVHHDGGAEHLTRAGLRRRVTAAATALAAAGVSTGDRVVVIAPNTAATVVAVLATTALGAAVSTAMPDMGPAALRGRLEQVEPAVLIVDRAGSGDWAGAPGDTLATLLDGLPTVRTVLLLDDQPLPAASGLPVHRWDTTAEETDGTPAEWPRLPFDSPLFVMFTSGATGPPKAMVHGIGGTLLEHLKEHRLHLDLAPGDVYLHHSTTAWMVWNRQLSALGAGCRIVLSDRALSGPETLWELAAEQGVTVLGTSPAYLQLCQDAGYRPRDAVDLTALRAVLSSGAVLHDWQFDWVADAVGDLPLQSISGGTDIIGAFVLGHPELPVRRGRIQARGLGMDVAAVDAQGRELVGEAGELVCRNPFPSRPVAFLRDLNGARRHAAYFAANPGMWTHGDVIEFDPDGSSRLHGRSDGVLNVDGVRIGPTEIYAVLRQITGVRDAMAVEQRHPTVPGATRLTLLVVLEDGVQPSADLARSIRTSLRRQASAAHVPSLILPVPALPLTHNGKKSERAARYVLDGEPVANLTALRNPDSVDGIARALSAAERDAYHAAADDAATDGLAATAGRLWRETLGPTADDEHTFTDLGGTSRQAMTLVRQVRQVLGRDVGLEKFMADPTLPGLIAAATAAPQADDAPHVVRLAAGDPALPPLFFVHDAWGDIDVYWPLAQLLTGTGPLFGLRADLQAPDGTRRLIGDLAADHVAEIARVTPAGPVRVAGHSFGGLVAYETARQLTAAGRTVDFLGLVDVLPPAAMLTSPERLVHEMVDRVSLLFPSMRNVTLREMVTERLRPSSAAADRQIFVQTTTVANEHAPGPYAGPVAYFRARRRLPGHHVLTAWRRNAPRLTVIDVPGAHHDVLGQQHVVEAARRWSRALAEANRGTAERQPIVLPDPSGAPPVATRPVDSWAR
ncbi:acetoacetate--CoA ligase [Krasilnikovia sp. M28-CT-15]|uniref:acetoacetate--CoA ligase n=1 Tax=Krasilnikovia sp. M28-CT-15 TaxID=3373540 RepID=UPI0038777A01